MPAATRAGHAAAGLRRRRLVVAAPAAAAKPSAPAAVLRPPLSPPVGAEADDVKIEKLVASMAGKSVADVITAGSAKLASVPSGGGGGGAAAAPAAAGKGGAPAAGKKEEPKKEEKKASAACCGASAPALWESPHTPRRSPRSPSRRRRTTRTWCALLGFARAHLAPAALCTHALPRAPPGLLTV